MEGCFLFSVENLNVVYVEISVIIYYNNLCV